MYLSLSLSLSLSLWLSSSLSFCWSGHVFSSPWPNVSQVKSIKDCSLKVFSKCICHCLCLLYLSSLLSFCWSGHVFSSLWSNVSKVKSLKDRSLKVFSKCHCLCRCLFAGQVMFLHDPHQFCEVRVCSGRLWIHNNEWNNDRLINQGRPRAAREAKKHFPEQLKKNEVK